MHESGKYQVKLLYQIEEDRYYNIAIYGVQMAKQIHKVQKRLPGLRRGCCGELLFNGDRISVRNNECVESSVCCRIL